MTVPYEAAPPIPAKSTSARMLDVVSLTVDLLVFLVRSVPVLFQLVKHCVVGAPRKNISGQTALVTGGANGLGLAIATELAKEGCNVVIADLDEVNAQEAATALRRYNVQSIGYKTDVADYEAVRQLARDIERDIGPVDILVNNAGILPMLSAQENQPSHIRRTLEVNVLSGFWTTHVFLDSMIRRRKGHIVAIASVASYASVGWAKSYGTSKYAVRGFMDALEDELYLRGQDEHVKTTTVFPFTFNTRKEAIERMRKTPALSGIPIYPPELLGEAVVQAIKANRRKVVVPGGTSAWQLAIYEHLPIEIKRLMNATFSKGQVKLID